MQVPDSPQPRDGDLNEQILQHLEAAGVSAALLASLRAELQGKVCGAGEEEGLRRALEAKAASAPAPALPLAPGRCRGTRPLAAGASGPCRGALPILLVVLCSLIFLPCVTYSEWYIDELFAAVRNADARGETPLRQVLAHDFWGNSLWDGGWTHKSYRPLVVLSYAFQYWLNDGVIRPQPLRAFNVALHVVNSVLLHSVLRRQGAPWRWACLSACLFAAHPVHCENVIYLVGRADALATTCWLVALLVWPHPHSVRRHATCSRMLRIALVIMLAVIGGVCKEIGFCVILQVAASEILGPWPVRGSVPLLTVFGLVFLGRSWFTDGTKAGFSYVDTPVQYHEDASVRLWTYLYFHAKYAQLIVFPWTLSWDYSYDALPLLRETWADVRSLSIVTTYLGVVAVAAWGLSARSRPVLLGLCNVLVPFVPASNLFFIVGVTVGERLLYPCNVGAAMVAAAIGGQRAGKHRSRGGRWRFALGLVLLGIFVSRCGLRVFQWSSKHELFGPDAAAYPRSTKARHQFGAVLHKEGRLEEALAHFNASLEVFPASALTEYLVAQVLIETNRAEEARRHFEHIFQGHFLGFGTFNLFALYVDYGFTFMLLRRFEEAIPYLTRGLEMNEDVPHGLNALGYSFMQLGRPKEALDAFTRGLHYDSTNPYLWNNAGVTMMLSGSLEQGAGLVARAFEALPDMPAFAHNARLVEALLRTNQMPGEQLVLEIFYNGAS